MKRKMVSVLLSMAMAATLAMPVLADDAALTELAPNDKGAEELTLWHYFDASADAQAIIDFCNEYNQLQDAVYINPTYVSRQELMNQYTIGAVSGELPDIGMVDSPDMASYISLGVFEDVSDKFADWDEIENFYPGLSGPAVLLQGCGRKDLRTAAELQLPVPGREHGCAEGSRN